MAGDARGLTITATLQGRRTGRSVTWLKIYDGSFRLYDSVQYAGDINGDGSVNIFDLSTLLSHWGTADTASDLNHDGTVNIFDLSSLLSHWGT